MMSELKKVSLTSLGPKKVPKKEEKEEKKSVRLCLTLTEPNKNGCPIFCFESLMKKELEKTQPKKVNGSGPFPEVDDADVAKLAKHYEDKYNDRRYTYAELGAGYDESDSFIDNTDIFQEELTNDECKRYKGFYINKEKFEESDEEPEKKIKRRRRSNALSDTESSSDSRSKKKIKHDKVKKKKPTTSVPLPNGSKPLSDSSMSGPSSSSSDSES